MLRLINIELYKIATKPRSYLGFLAITVIILLIQFALYLDGETYIKFLFTTLDQSFTVQGKILNGYFVSFIILQMLILQMPLLVVLVTGDLISGEAGAGTIRLWATRPYSRAKLLMAKYIAGSIYTFGLIAWLAFLALGVGLMIFGSGDLIVGNSTNVVILQGDDIFWRFVVAFGVAFLSLSVVSTFSLMLSCFTDNSIGPIITSMSVVIIFTIIGTLEVPLFDEMKYYLFTTHMNIWRNLFDKPLLKPQIIQSLLILAGHIAVFLSVAFYHFTKKDIQN